MVEFGYLASHGAAIADERIPGESARCRGEAVCTFFADFHNLSPLDSGEMAKNDK